jgi:hypothetical protein
MKRIDAIKTHLENIEVEIEQLRKLMKIFTPPNERISSSDTMIIGKAKYLVQTHTKLEQEIK